MKRLTIVYLLFCILFLSSCTSNKYFLRADVIGFSNSVRTSYDSKRGIFSGVSSQTEPYNLLDVTYNRTTGKNVISINRTEQSKLQTELYLTPREDMTAVDYAMVLAAKRVNYIRRRIAKNDPNTKYYIFLLTDGTDNVSPEMAKREYDVLFPKTAEKYEARVQNKLKGAMGLFAKNQFEVYPMIFVGEDMQETQKTNKVSDEQFKKFIDNKMEHFRYSSVGEAPKVIQATDYGDLIKELRKKFGSPAYRFRIPTSYTGKQIRMTLEDRNGNKATLTGTFKKEMANYVLSDVQIKGITIDINTPYTKDNGKIIVATDAYNGNAYFTLNDLRVNSVDPYFPVCEKATQEVNFSGMWQLNSEYNEKNELIIDTYFMIVLDGSKSLDGKNGTQKGFEKELKMANDIVMMVLNPNKETQE